MASADQVRKLLESLQTDGGSSVYEHLVETFTQLLYDNPENPLEAFENYSLFVKEHHFQPQDPSPVNLRKTLDLFKKEVSTWITTTRKLIDVMSTQKPREEGEDGVVQETVPEALAYIPDLQQEANWLKWAGLGFSEEETFRLQMSLKVPATQKLMVSSGAKELRLWGKISGSRKDYYVAEGQADAPEAGGEEGEPPADFEAHGTGINTNSYWVTDSPTGQWTMLPDVTPTQLNIARRICKLFTGDLDAPVVSNPHFPGKEKELLRCQIARIYYGTNIVPVGLYKINEDDPTQVDAEEEPKTASNRDLMKLDNWVHYQPGILLCGRLTHMEPEQPEGEEEVDPEILKARQLAADPLIPRLKPLSQDTRKHHVAVPGFKNAWVIRMAGDSQQYSQNTAKKEAKEYAFNVLKSLWWPGTVVVQRDGRWISFYVGDGLKVKLHPMYPVNPPVIQAELPDGKEQPEPTPLNAPPPPEVEEEAPKDGEEGEEES